MSRQTLQASYDQIAYPCHPHPPSHPDRLATVARLFGLRTADVQCCRVLELGCADGGNLIPMACALPESEFVGIELSARQTAAGREVVNAVGLANIELRQMDLLDVGEELGQFDYIVAHGAYSWVSADGRKKILQVCKERLGPKGVAYVSYNTYPGWAMRGMLRDMMLYHSRKFSEPQTQIDQARALINWLSDSVSTENSPYGMLLKTELDHMRTWPDSYFWHDSLEEFNAPFYFHEFMASASSYGLQYLGDADFHTMVATNYATRIAKTLNRLGRDIVEMEQYMDFVQNRMFRQTLLCHGDIRLERALGPKSVTDFHVAAPLRPADPKSSVAAPGRRTFISPTGLTVSTPQPVATAALRYLGELWPQSIHFRRLLGIARESLLGRSPVRTEPAALDLEEQGLAGTLLTCFSRKLCELRTTPSRFTTEIRTCPRADALARFQAANDRAIANRRHELVKLDTFGVLLLRHLDGTRDREALLATMCKLVSEGALVTPEDEQAVTDLSDDRQKIAGQLDAKLKELAQLALMVE